jgi:GNAT superfamily N-acetyltransferase
MSVQIRDATCADVRGIAQVHVASWQSTYHGLMPQSFLNGLTMTIAAREKYWQSVLCAEPRSDYMLVAEDAGQIVGFACAGEERTGSYGIRGELYAIYLLASHQRKGIGRQFMQAIGEYLLQSNMQDMLVWVLKENPSREFYERLGGEPVASQLVTIGGVTFEETGYRWSDITQLAMQKK